MYIKSAKEPSNGVFWIIDNTLYVFTFADGPIDGRSASGTTLNHRRLWPSIKPRGCNKPYNYYPRGRVEFNSKQHPVVYLNPNIDETWIHDIKVGFGLRESPIMRYDYSQHYKCYLDDGWKSE